MKTINLFDVRGLTAIKAEVDRIDYVKRDNISFPRIKQIAYSRGKAFLIPLHYVFLNPAIRIRGR